ncbi:MAG: hypothetical protein U0353_10125 [Sandaracinus sp.]
MSTWKLEHVPNPTGKGAPSFMVNALAFHPPSRRIAGVTADFGCFFDVESGAQGVRWKETSGGDCAVFRADGQLVIVGAALAQVTPGGKRSALTKSLFPGVDPVFSATSTGELAVVSVCAGEQGRVTMRGVDLTTGQARWTQKTFVGGLTTHAGEVYGFEGARVVKVDLAKGTLTTVLEAPGELACLHADEEGLWVCEQTTPVVHHFDPRGAHRAQLAIGALHALRQVTRVRGEVLVAGVTLHDVVDGFPQSSPFPIAEVVSIDRALREATPLGYQDACGKAGWKPASILAIASAGDALWIGTSSGLLRAR